MIQQTGQAVTFYFWFTKSKVGQGSLTVTVDVGRKGSGSLIVTGGSATAFPNVSGLYYYTLSGASTGNADDYLAVGKTTDTTVDAQHVPAMWVVGPTWAQNLDAAISSVAAAVWAVATSGLTAAGTVGKKLADFLAALGSDSRPKVSADVHSSGETVAAVAGNVGGNVVGFLTSAGNPVTVVSNTDKAGYSLSVTPPTAAQIRAEIDSNSTQLAAILTHLPARIKKNAAFANFPFYLVQSSDHVSPKTGAAPMATRSIDGGAFGACDNDPVEIGDGWYAIDLSAADLNGNAINIVFSASGADDRPISIITNP